MTDSIKYIKKEDLIIDTWYEGDCRNSSFAKWNGNVFEYVRYKMGHTYIDDVKCVEEAHDWEDIFIAEKPVDDMIVVVQLERDFNKIKGEWE